MRQSKASGTAIEREAPQGKSPQVDPCETLRDLVLPDVIESAPGNPSQKSFKNLHPFDARSSIADEVLREALRAQKSFTPLRVLSTSEKSEAHQILGDSLTVDSKDIEQLAHQFNLSVRPGFNAECVGCLVVAKDSRDGLNSGTLMRDDQGKLVCNVGAVTYQQVVNAKHTLGVKSHLNSEVFLVSLFVGGNPLGALRGIAVRKPSSSRAAEVQPIIIPALLSAESQAKDSTPVLSRPDIKIIALSPSSSEITAVLRHADAVGDNFRKVLTEFAKEVRSNDKVRVFHGKEWLKHEQELLLLMQRLAVEYLSNIYTPQTSIIGGLLKTLKITVEPDSRTAVSKREISSYAEMLSEVRKHSFAGGTPRIFKQIDRRAKSVEVRAKSDYSHSPITTREGETDRQAYTNHRIRTFAQSASSGIESLLGNRAIASGQIATKEISLRAISS